MAERRTGVRRTGAGAVLILLAVAVLGWAAWTGVGPYNVDDGPRDYRCGAGFSPAGNEPESCFAAKPVQWLMAVPAGLLGVVLLGVGVHLVRKGEPESTPTV